MFLGMGKLRMDLRYLGQGLTLFGRIWNPANSAVSLANINLSLLRMISLWPQMASQFTACEAFLHSVVPLEGVITSFNILGDIGNNLIITSCVAITKCNVTLRGSAVVVATTRGDKGGQVAFIPVDRDTVISIPCIKNCFLGAKGDGSCLVK